MPFAVLIQILKQFLTWDLLTLLDDACQATIVNRDTMPDSTFAAKLETDVAAANMGVGNAERREPERVVGPRILIIADANQRCFQETNDRGQYFGARQARQLEVLLDPPTDARQRGANASRRSNLEASRIERQRSW